MVTFIFRRIAQELKNISDVLVHKYININFTLPIWKLRISKREVSENKFITL